MIYNKSTLLTDNTENQIIKDSIAMLGKAGYAEDYIGLFIEKAISVLDDYAHLIGEGTAVEYIMVKKLLEYQLRIRIEGPEYDPFKTGSGSKKRIIASVGTMNLNTGTARVAYNYAHGFNIITVGIPLSERHRSFLKDPMVLAVVLGIVLGLVCQHIPAAANSFIVDDIASPVMSIILAIMSGIMGPVIFISMVTSIIAMDSINELTDLGSRILHRFILVTLFLTAVSIAVSAVFFRSIGTETVNISPRQLVQMVLDIFPTNPLQSFLDNKTPQIVILGFLLGSALLLLGDSVSELKVVLMQVNEWAMSVMRIVLITVPAIPFLSIFTCLAKNRGGEILEGWKFILASYLAFTISVVVKLVKVSAVTGIKIPELWRKCKPLIKMAFTTGSTSAPVKKAYEISKEDFHIKPEFTSFWIPMCSAMLSPKTTINVVLATLMVAQMTGVAVTTSFLLVLVLVTLELSIASPGTTSAWTIMFVTFSMPTSYVGLFTVYRLLTNNYEGGCTEAYVILEEVEAAKKLGAMEQNGT